MRMGKRGRLQQLVSGGVLGVFCFVSFVFFIGQEVGESKIEKFLDNIRQILKKEVEKIKKETSSREDKKRAAIKVRQRKQIIQKLATPFVLRHKHRRIEYNKAPSTQGKQQSNNVNTKNQAQGLPITSQTLIADINRFFRQNPFLMPFKFPDLS